MNDELFAELGREIARQLGPSMDDHVEDATEALEDDDMIAFAVVGIAETGDGTQAYSQRAIDPERVLESDREPEEVVDALHEALCHVFDEGVRQR